ncbi:hypothetical protein B9Z55_014355 [Caenorhabditis nigoni]|uniref:Uncharacterized protein n=1 Tax=Caenorhabditis nigoni TaxID=1611254 RepID=A0A2G5U5M2_9PELO|nr:hypothetical protein B9Z55_014355 [Caenorhabditis nigoni]
MNTMNRIDKTYLVAKYRAAVRSIADIIAINGLFRLAINTRPIKKRSSLKDQSKNIRGEENLKLRIARTCFAHRAFSSLIILSAYLGLEKSIVVLIVLQNYVSLLFGL